MYSDMCEDLDTGISLLVQTARANRSTEIQTCQEGKVDIFTFQTDSLLFYYAMPCAISL